MWPLPKCFATLLALSLLTGCNSLQVRVEQYQPPPIPQEYLALCEEPEPIPDGKLETLYLQLFRDAEPWRQCRSRHQQLVSLLKYREQVQADLRNLAQSHSWYEFWK